MASSPASSGSWQDQNSGSEQALQQIMEQRKRKRMISNRESARRSRMRKQQHLDELMAQASQLRNENNHFLTNINITTQLYLNVEAENSVLSAQMAELTHRLQSLNDIINCLNTAAINAAAFDQSTDDHDDIAYNDNINDLVIMDGVDDDFLNPWNLLHVNQPVMTSADAFIMY